MELSKEEREKVEERQRKAIDKLTEFESSHDVSKLIFQEEDIGNMERVYAETKKDDAILMSVATLLLVLYILWFSFGDYTKDGRSFFKYEYDKFIENQPRDEIRAEYVVYYPAKIEKQNKSKNKNSDNFNYYISGVDLYKKLNENESYYSVSRCTLKNKKLVSKVLY